MKHSVRLFFFLFAVVLVTSCGNRSSEKKNTNSSDSNKILIADKPSNPYSPVDISPMDMSYYPVDYPKLEMAKQISTAPLARVIYSRPHLQGRTLFKDVLKYGEAWRLGANESTELDLYTDANVEGKSIKAGRYVLYCLPQPDKWTIIINTNIDSWGLQPDSTKDLARFVIPVKKTSNHLEYYTMVFEKTDAGTDLLMAWDDLEARLPINFNAPR